MVLGIIYCIEKLIFRTRGVSLVRPYVPESEKQGTKNSVQVVLFVGPCSHFVYTGKPKALVSYTLQYET